MAKGKTIQEQFTELTPSRLKEIRGYIVRKYLRKNLIIIERRVLLSNSLQTMIVSLTLMQLLRKTIV